MQYRYRQSDLQPVRLVAPQSPSDQERPSPPTHRRPTTSDCTSKHLSPDVSIKRLSVPPPQTPQKRLMNRKRPGRGNGISRGMSLRICVIGGVLNLKSYSDERYMVARILVGTAMSIITRMDNPQWFKENAEPHVFSQARYDKIVEDLKALGTEDPNAVQALVCDASFSLQSTYLTLNRKGKFFGRLRRLNIPLMQRPCSRSSIHYRAISTPKRRGCSQH